MSSESPRHLFVCGLHRSGTTLITRSLAEHPGITGFRGTGVIEDEGQFLQTVLPVENSYGGVGRFGFDPRAHMTEESPFNTPENAQKLTAEWGRYWDPAKPVRIEKTPSNLLRMRLVARLMPQSRFLVVTRHPVATCLATMKWTQGNLFSLLTHWVHCHRIARADSSHLPHVLWMSYEAVVADPKRELTRVLAFAGLPPSDLPSEALNDANGRYFQQWRQQVCGDTDRAIPQVPPEHYRSILTRIRERITRKRAERTNPLWRRRETLARFHDALDAASLLEDDVNAFGYSFRDLDRAPG
jgi:hypothetical protein